MSLFKLVAVLCFLPSFVYTKPVAQEAPWQTATADAPAPESTACGQVIDSINEGYYVFDALSAYECLSTVPFLDAVATRFIDYYNTTIQFQSTLAYLRDPPSTYQQPAIDVLGILEQIKQNITTGYYKNQYDFEATIQSMVYGMHDDHVDLTAGILAAFSFGGYYDIMSVSVDGKQAPQIYIKDDVIASQAEGWTPSPVVSINGQDIVEYLTDFAALQSLGMLDPNADWNQLMYSPVQDIQGIYNTFGWDAIFYPGDELNYTLANGTTWETIFLAFYNNPYPTGPLTTGGDFYNYFVLGLLPASYVDISDNTSTVDNTTAVDYQTIGWSNVTAAYPSNPDIVQQDLSITGGGFITAYFLNDTSTGVISIPSFNQYGDFVGSFSNTTSQFIERAKALKMSRIVIDVQQNFGGTSLLAIDTFRQFFPNIKQFAGSRRRDHYLANVLGDSVTEWWSSLTPANDLYDDYYAPLAANEWILTDRLNAATGKNFTSWSEYYGPLSQYNGDQFSLIEQYDLDDTLFDAAAFDGWVPSGYNDPDTLNTPPPFAAENIVILTDGICSSSCALFVEMMTKQAGVRTVVVGGRPQSGPMQAVGGSRGARAYDSYALDSDMALASQINNTALGLLPQVRDPNIWTAYAGFNLRDEIRANESEPLQFKYEAANCRIYYTLANAYNMSRLWRDAASATWDNPSLCVTDSRGYATTGNSTTAKTPPSSSDAAVYHAFAATETGYNVTYTGGIPDDRGPRVGGTVTPCPKSNSCPGACQTVQCLNSGPRQACLPSCSNPGGPCGNNGFCRVIGSTESKKTVVRGQTIAARSIVQAQCFPNYGTTTIGCPYAPP